jgi:hypothetical protein
MHFNRGRAIVFPLIEKAISQGVPRRKLRQGVKLLAADREWFPSERRLSEIIAAFSK